MLKNWNEIVDKCVQGGVATLNCVPAVFLNIVTALLAFVGFFALFLFIFSGYKYMNSGGDAKKLEGARHTLIYGIVGLFIVLFSFLIIQIISTVTNVPCILKFGFGCQ